MLLIAYSKSMARLLLRRLSPSICVFTLLYFVFIYGGHPDEFSTTHVVRSAECDLKLSTDEFIRHYKPDKLLGTMNNSKRAEPTVERIRTLLEIIRLNESDYQPLLQSFDVFDMSDPNGTLKAYTGDSNMDEIKLLYNRYIKLMSDGRTIKINETFIDYLRKTSSYLSDGLRNKRTEKVNKHKFQFFVIFVKLV